MIDEFRGFVNSIVSNLIAGDDDFIVVVQNGQVVKTLISVPTTESIFEGGCL